MPSNLDRPWDFRCGYNPDPKRGHESKNAYIAFCSYLKQGEKHSLAAVAKKFSVHRVTVRRWSCYYRWIDRAAAFHQWLKTQTNPDGSVLTAALENLVASVNADVEKAQADQQAAAAKLAARMTPPLAEQVEALTPSDEQLDLEAHQLAQQEHLARLRSYQQRVEAVGKSQLVMSGQFIRLASDLLADHRRKRADSDAPVPYATLDMARHLAATAAQLGAAGRDLEGSALGVNEMLQALEVIRQNDARLLGLERADVPAEP